MGKVKVKCKVCGKIVFLWPSRVRNAKYCSRQCYYLSKIGKPNPAVSKWIIKFNKLESTKKLRRKAVLGKKNPMYGRRGKLNPFYGKKHTNTTKRKCRKGRLKQKNLPSQNTIPEQIVANILTKHKINYKTNYHYGFYEVDIALPKKKIAIEVDGIYWHSLPHMIKRDKAKDTYLKNRGWRIIRIKAYHQRLVLPNDFLKLFNIDESEKNIRWSYKRLNGLIK